MALNTANYGYLVDPLLPIVDEAGQIVKGGFIVVLESSTSAKVYTYKDWNESLNPVQITIDNSGRVGSYVIVNKDKLYKILVCDAAHGEENPIRVVDKVAVTGANVTNTGAITQGLNSAQSSLSSVTVTVTDNKLYVGGTLDQSLSTINSKLNAVRDSFKVVVGNPIGTLHDKYYAGYRCYAYIGDLEYEVVKYDEEEQRFYLSCVCGNKLYKTRTGMYVVDDDPISIETPTVYDVKTTDDALNASISAEATARQAADSALDGKITAEATTRGNADTALGARIDAEASARANADTALDGRVTTLEQAMPSKANSADVTASLALKADKSTTYTKTEVNTALGTKANSADVYTKGETDTSLALKADKSTTYTKTEVDTALGAKANASTTYTKTQVDNLVSPKADKTYVDGLVGDVESLLAAL